MIRRLACSLIAIGCLVGCSAETLDAGSTLEPVTGKATTRATFAKMIDAITMDASSLYFTSEDGWVYRLEKSGSSAPVRIAKAAAPGSLYTEGIAVDDTDVYWTALGDGLAGGAFFRAPKTGGDAEAIAKNVARPWGVALDKEHVFWAVQDAATPINTGTGGIGKGGIERASKAGGGRETVAEDLNAPDFVVIDEQGGVVWHEAYAIRRVASPGAAPLTLLSRPVAFRTTNLVATSSEIAWADEPADVASVWTVSPAHAAVALAKNVDAPAWLVASGSNVFWNVAAGRDVGAIYGSPTSGHGAKAIASNDAYGDIDDERALFLLADESAFYWVVSFEAKDLTVAIRTRPR
jgi:hypothetical protein